MDEITFNGPVKADVQAIGPGSQANKLNGTSPPPNLAPVRAEQNASSKITFNSSVTAGVQAIGSGVQANEASQPQKALSILFALSSPRSHEMVRLNEEIRAVEQTLERSKHRDLIYTKVLHAATSNDLQHEMRTHTYHILHLAGHGVSSGFVLEDEYGRPYKVAREALADYLSNYQRTLRCVVLSACYSLSLGESLSPKIPFVICINGPIHDPAAVAFSQGFYDAIGAGYAIEDAYSEGMGAMNLMKLDHYPLILLIRGNAR